MPAGRPAIILDESRIVELASKGLTQKEIAAIMGVSSRTIERNYGESCEKGRELCNGMLRAKQVEVALAGNPTMLIWLGKQNLGQRDRAEVEHKYDVSLGAIPATNGVERQDRVN